MTRRPHPHRAHHHPTQIRGARVANAVTWRRWPATAATILILTSTSALPASARPEPGPPPPYTTSPSTQQQACPLTRLGAQLVRCDDLTGAGAPAPLWVQPWSPDLSRSPSG